MFRFLRWKSCACVVLGLGAVLFLPEEKWEYIASDTADIRHGPATAALTAVSFAIFLILAIAVKAAGLRSTCSSCW